MAIAPHADLVSLSFVRSVDDVVELRAALDQLGYPNTAIGVKIEHAAAFAGCPTCCCTPCSARRWR